ncbi:hypothetical protein JF544_16480 [Halobacillus kuroshimensis]|uniref:Helix-turn-helix domain-containing protein n=1 Tax=Halobacillus kuroshimensis TaxID=302481 RepID=A0ABS3DZU4_9BACI|nr:hypothetical protein [Halobacillus kuroshimensis]MBN8236856.1 hypothetical protein [Halobacillus kuroshimensis]
MPDQLYFPTHEGLLSKEHRERIGPALWEFLWCISKTTKEEGKTGIVLGGKPVGYQEVAKELGGSKSTVKRNFERLEKEKYITMKRTPYGHIINVHNSKKFTKSSSKSAENSMGAKSGTGAKNEHRGAIYGQGGAIYGHSNKDKEVDKELDINTTTTTARENSPSEFGTPETVKKEVDSEVEVLVHRYLRFNQQMHPTPKDFQAAKEILQEGVPIAKACEYLQEFVDSFNRNRKHQRQKINGLNYCVGYILDKHYEQKDGGENVKSQGRHTRSSFSRKNGKSAEDVIRQKQAAKRAWGGV